MNLHNISTLFSNSRLYPHSLW